MTDSRNFIRSYSEKKEYETSEWTIQKYSASQASCLRVRILSCHALVSTCILLPIACLILAVAFHQMFCVSVRQDPPHSIFGFIHAPFIRDLEWLVKTTCVTLGQRSVY
ncbi:uncharacterized protein EURHEDRAFT_202056 [Aspergillus ruber CBS 135680]|uniref:Uncharacterized protein n=1 Tax=Aspergillus ruber (strain CBS 135680) TaxID=1388766 RepID=A0A017S5G2_ASPRC|nr:uncharacterized protein EURHEDRAFT_202056 [Aspergillus ruber CBS 135680]EYE92041.1 hypothetical protein EURHEDRAFT_202056 [Aspergillus ruber CBS 135680]